VKEEEGFKEWVPIFETNEKDLRGFKEWIFK